MATQTEINAPVAGPVTLPSGVLQFIAFDFGTKRIGLAVGNRITQTAQPLTTVTGSDEARWRYIDQLIHEWAPDALVVGVPYHPDGNAHVNTKRALTFGRTLRDRYKRQVFEVDERYTTVEAISMGACDPDAAAACLILEQFMRSCTP